MNRQSGSSGSGSKRPHSGMDEAVPMMTTTTVSSTVSQLAATATRETIRSSSTTTTMMMEEDDEHMVRPNKTTSNSTAAKYQYVRLPFYGEHKRAISTVKVAPDRICYHRHSKSSAGSNNSVNSNDFVYNTMTASASADGICKLWNVSLPYYYDNTAEEDDDNDDRVNHNPPPHGLRRGIMRSLPSHNNNNNNSSSRSHSFSHNRTNNSFTAITPYTILTGSHTRGINDISWNPVVPTLMATASDDKTVKLWDCVGGSTTSTTTTSNSINATSSHHTSSSSSPPNSGGASSTNTIVEPMVELVGHDHFVFCVDQYRHICATGSFDETIKLWDIRTGDCISTLPAHSDPVTSVAFNRDGTMIVSGSHDGLIRFWDVMTGECLKTLYATNNPPVSSVTYAPNGKYILAGTLDNTLRLWPVTTTTSSSSSSSSSSMNHCTKTYRYNEHTTNHQYLNTLVDSSASYFRNTKYSIASAFTYDGNIFVGNETGNPVLFDLQTGNVLQVLHQLPMTPQQQQQLSSGLSKSPSSKTTKGSDPMDTTTTESMATPSNDDPSLASPTQPPLTPTGKDHSPSSHYSHNNAVLAVSAHDTQPFLCTGSMGTKRVEFWSWQPVLPDGTTKGNDERQYHHRDREENDDHATTSRPTGPTMMVVDLDDPISRPVKQRKNKKVTKPKRSN